MKKPVRQLAEVIEARREEITQRWADQLFATGVPESLAREAVIDSMREFLTELAEALRREQGFHQHSQPVEASAIAKGHGKQRFGMGYDIGAVIREYGTLRDIIFQYIEESGLSPSVQEFRVLSRYLIGGIADAATQYALERDEALKKQTATHLGFLAHELRNPLSSIRLSLATMQQRGELPQVRAMERVHHGLERLSELIDNSLVEIRLAALPGVQREEVAIDELLHSLVEESAAEVEAKGLKMSVEVEPGLRLSADPRLLHSALSNLVRNAVKFTHEGGTISLRAKKDATRMVLEVEDECGGLPEGTVQKLFNPFVQVGKDRSGFGLGLAIAKQAVEAHEGELRVHDLPGKGCVFVMDLPKAPVPIYER
jgi:signal transduction histidine kinase